MGKLLNLAIYTPAQLNDEDFLKCFVARHELANKILARLGEIKPRGAARHGLIIGQRGMGKTSMLRRIALGVRETPELAAAFLPLSFREEQYNIHNLHVFWCNCIDALGDFYDATGQHKQADKLDMEVSSLNRCADDEEGNNALSVFREWIKREEKRPLLLLDNIDLIFDGLKDKQWSLRRILQEAGGVIVIGASAGFLEATSNPKAAFYDFFKVDVLEKLSHEELFSCLRQLAVERGEPGQKVLRILEREPARIHALYDLTGGNPRTLSMLYLMLEVSEDGNIMYDLERLLDQSTPLYKAKVEEFAIQARVVFDAVALAWNPITAADVATITGLEVGAVSTQLDRLFKNGVLEKTSLSSTSRIGFMLAERFFNIWYLMRHAPRRQRNRLRWLVEFLRKFYTPPQLADHAAKLIKIAAIDNLTHGTYCLAMSEAIEDGGLKNVLRHEAKQDMERYALEQGVSLENLVNPDEFFTPNNSTEWLEHGHVLHKKIRDYKKAETAYRKAIELDPKLAAPWRDLGGLLHYRLTRYDEAEAAYRKAIELDPKVAAPWTNLGDLLQYHLTRYDEAETAYRKAIELDPKLAAPWRDLGRLLHYRLTRYDEAETTYRKAIEFDPKLAAPWNDLGNLLQYRLTRYDEAETAYRKAIELDPKLAAPWTNLGDLLQYHLNRYDEAETAYRKAIELDPKLAAPWRDLGRLLHYRLTRYDEAEAVYRKAIELDPKLDRNWRDMGHLLEAHFSRYHEALDACQRAVELDVKSKKNWCSLGYLLFYFLNRLEEARAAYEKALALEPDCIVTKTNLLVLQLITGSPVSEAEFETISTLHPPYGAALLRSVRAITQENFGEAVSYFKVAVSENMTEVLDSYRGIAVLILRQFATRGYGDKLLAWMNETQIADQYWPLYIAFNAYLHGENKLRDINPEVRGVATPILAWLKGHDDKF